VNDKPFSRHTKDITNQEFGLWTVDKFHSVNRFGHAIWECHCACGTQRLVMGHMLRNGKSNCCGCLGHHVTHGKYGTKVHKTWLNMMRRCYKPSSISYPNYGGRGIIVHEDWHDFLTFYADMGDPPSDAHTIERIDNEGPYSKENCKWLLAALQAGNRRNNTFINIGGEQKHLAAWCRFYNIKPATVCRRIKSGMSPFEALTTPLMR
jgi:hypothetical protein